MSRRGARSGRRAGDERHRLALRRLHDELEPFGGDLGTLDDLRQEVYGEIWQLYDRGGRGGQRSTIDRVSAMIVTKLR